MVSAEWLGKALEQEQQPVHPSVALADAAAASSCRSFPCVLRCTSAPSLATTSAAATATYRCRCWSKTCQAFVKGHSAQDLLSNEDRVIAAAVADAYCICWNACLDGRHACAARSMCYYCITIHKDTSMEGVIVSFRPLEG